jgi:hypothetical protein
VREINDRKTPDVGFLDIREPTDIPEVDDGKIFRANVASDAIMARPSTHERARQRLRAGNPERHGILLPYTWGAV